MNVVPPHEPPAELDIDRNALVRLQEFVACVDAVMNALPHPVPPAAPTEWDGQILAVRAFYDAYNRLPAPLQAIAARGYEMCEHALTAQVDTAWAARRARYWVLSDLVLQTGLRPEQLVPDDPEHGYLTLVRDEDDPEHDEDEDDALRRAVLETLAAHDAMSFAPASAAPIDEAGESEDAASADESEDAASVDESEGAASADDEGATSVDESADEIDATPDDTASSHAAWAFAIGAVVAVAAVIVLAWPQPAPAPSAVDTRADKPAAPAAAPTFPIERSARSGDLTVIMSHGEENDGGVSLHTHIVNDGETEHEADITVHDGDDDTPVLPPERIPPKSTRHRVIKVPRKRRGKTMSVTIGGAKLENIRATVTSER